MTGWLADQMATHGMSTTTAAISAANCCGSQVAVLDWWAANVKSRARWDFKVDVTTRAELDEPTSYIQLGTHSLHFEVMANIFYGFMGRSLGFSKATLTTGAGIAQAEHGVSHWQTNFARSPRYVGDEALDGWAVDFGYYLYDQYGERPGLLTAGALSRALDTYIAEHPAPAK